MLRATEDLKRHSFMSVLRLKQCFLKSI